MWDLQMKDERTDSERFDDERTGGGAMEDVEIPFGESDVYEHNIAYLRHSIQMLTDTEA